MATIEDLANEIASLRRRVESAESLLALQALKAGYGDLVDQRFSHGEQVDEDSLHRVAEAAAQLFTEDGVWDGGSGLGRHVGRAAIAARLARPTLSFSRHLFVKPRIDVDGDRARGRWDLLCPCRREDGSSWWMCGFEDDEYVRVDGVWVHQKMELTTVFLSRVDQGWEQILA
jgi:SnoaL-like domain